MGKPPRKEVTAMDNKKSELILLWLALSLLFGTSAWFLKALAELIRLFI
jgi:hypothetical protein